MSTTELNPAGYGFFNAIENGAGRQSYVIDPDVDGLSPFGTVMELEDWDGPGTGPTLDPPLIQPATTDQGNGVIGVLVGGLAGYSGQVAAVAAGKIGQIMTEGVCQVLCDATTTAGDPLISSPDTAGCAQSSSSPSTRTIGLCLQSLTISSGTRRVWAFVAPGTQGGSGGGGGGVTQLLAGDNITLDPDDGEGTVTISAATGTGSFPTSTGSGSPQGVVTSGAVGDSYQDTDSGALYLALDTTDTGWVLLGGPGVGNVSGIIEGTSGVTITAAGEANGGIQLVDNGTGGGGVSITSDAGAVFLASNASGIQTGPNFTLDTATTAFGQVALGTALQNNTGSDLLVVVVVPVTAAAGGQLQVGVDFADTPTLDDYTPALAAAAVVPVVAWVPSGWYLLVDTTGTITAGTPVTTASPL